MEIEVVGRHALLFDDDAAANFVNSKEALVEWNSLSIDRYDVRHLLSSLPASFRRRKPGSSPLPDSHLESELDLERYADLPSPSDEPQSEPETDMEPKAMNTGGYCAVPFSYGNAGGLSEQRDDDAGFQPPFSIPENLVQNLPPTEKTHQIIARTAIFVSEHGGQSEIVLRVKQGDNPTFGFLMPHHHLHPYFRYLVDHPEILKENKNSPQNQGVGETTGGALSLLGSVYGDEDAEVEDVNESVEKDLKGISPLSNVPSPNRSDEVHGAGSVSQSDEVASKPQHPSKVKVSLPRKDGANHAVKPKSNITMKKEVGMLGSSNNGHVSKVSTLPSMSKGEYLPIEPPTELKRLVDRIVEIVLKNGQGFEALLIEQDKNLGKFPFLLPSNDYHPYYLQVLENAQKSKISGKSSSVQNDVNAMESELYSSVDIPFNCDKKEKFKMVIGKSKKDTLEQPSNEVPQQNGVSVDVDAAAAILQAATRGIKNPNLDIFSKTSSGGASSLGSFQNQRSNHKHSGSEVFSVGVPAAKQIARTAALVAAGEADSSQAGLTKEEKLKAERLKRAKMFAAMIKSTGAAPLGKEAILRASSSDVEIRYQEVKETKGSSAPENDRTSKAVMTEREHSDNRTENDEKMSRKNRRYRSKTREKKEAVEDEEVEEMEKEVEEDERHLRKKHRSHRSRHHRDRSNDRHKHRKRHSSSKDRESSKSRHRHKHESASEEDDIDEHRRYRKHHHYHSSSEDESRRHRHKRSHTNVDRNGDDERMSSSKHRKKSHSSSKVGLDEEEEINAKAGADRSPSTVVDATSREASVDNKLGSNPNQEKRSPSQPLESSDVPDELRAKIRAMLLATL